MSASSEPQLIELAPALRRRWWLILVVALAAGAATFGLSGVDRAQLYRSSATVALPDRLASRPETEQAVSNLRAVATSDALLAPIADREDLPLRQVRDALTTVRDGDSALVAVSYTGPDPEQTSVLVQRIATGALEFLYEREHATTTSAVEAAETRYDEITTAMDELVEETDSADPAQLYATLEAERSALQVRLSSAGLSPEGGAIADAIRDLEASLTELRPAAVQFARLRSDETGALGALNDARQQAAAVGARTDTSASSDLVTLTRDGVPVRTTMPAVRKAAGAALLAASALVILLVAMRRGGPHTVASVRTVAAARDRATDGSQALLPRTETLWTP